LSNAISGDRRERRISGAGLGGGPQEGGERAAGRDTAVGQAGGAPVRIRLCYRPPATTVEVTNAPGSPAAHAVASGFGLVGLRERVTALGGHLHAGPGGAGSWRLAARIPHPAPLEQNGTPT
jgi:hypothetical protein